MKKINSRGDWGWCKGLLLFLLTIHVSLLTPVYAQHTHADGSTHEDHFLRTTNDAYQIRLRYVETLRSYNQSILTINYLKGTL